MANAGICDGRLRAFRRRYAVYAEDGPNEERGNNVRATALLDSKDSKGFLDCTYIHSEKSSAQHFERFLMWYSWCKENLATDKEH